MEYNLSMNIEDAGGKGPEKKELSENEKESLIRGTHSFDQLYAAIDKIGAFQGSQETFDASQLRDKVDRARSGAIDITYITRAHGLRETVARLLQSATSDEQVVTEEAPALSNPSEEVSVPTEAALAESPELEEAPLGGSAIESLPQQEKLSVIDFTAEQIEDAREEMEAELLERKKVEIISRAAEDASNERVKQMVVKINRSLNGRAEGANVWEGVRAQLDRRAQQDLSSLLQTVRTEAEPNSILSQVAAAIDKDYSTSRGGVVDNTIAGSLLSEYIQERGTELTGEELGEVEDALHLIGLSAQQKFFQFQNAEQLRIVAQAQEDLIRCNDEFDPARSGFFELRNAMESARASIRLDLNTKPNYQYSHPEYSVRDGHILRVLSSLHTIEALKFLKEHDIEIE